MNRAQAKGVIGMLSAAFPREPMPDSTVEMWASALVETEYADGVSAVEDLALGMDRMPSLRQIIAAAKEAKRDRFPELPSGEPEGPTLVEWLAENPEYRERVEAITRGPARSEVPDRERKVGKRGVIADIRKMAQNVDRPQTKQPRKKSECKEHEYFVRDRCYWCGTPLEVNA